MEYGINKLEIFSSLTKANGLDLKNNYISLRVDLRMLVVHLRKCKICRLVFLCCKNKFIVETLLF